ncbi:hypothetical protein QA645_22890 [Bradyrhizobium sp. CIAT3101]|uniref:hypothetical protein n=1 Tax=Bradyrhizobium sp. CIAT3101 TaxID=439387 RepID=UPI0024B14858|nr:hypothetical protein [Bradyrhizobium sp. CIAT3101]WFU77404.1 hypothetical protein QA645_22890 [Bradyrhizobium sp. CIAT3101]
MPLMPCFEPGQAEEQGKIIGKILVGYGELEVGLLSCLVAVERHIDLPVKRLFERMPAEKRIKLARQTLLPAFADAGLEADMKECLADLDWCRDLRNQYAHCQWGWTSNDGLFFVNLEQLAANHVGPITRVMNHPRYLGVSLLKEQEAYGDYVRECFIYLETAYQAWDRRRRDIAMTAFVFSKPPKITRPCLHN